MPQQNIDVILRLLNSRRFQNQLRAASSSARAFGQEMEGAARASNSLNAAGQAASGTLYGIAGAARAVSFGIAAAGAATIGFGVSFNATMEANELAFSRFAGSAQESKQLVTDLWEIAEQTPFEFTDITTAGRKFLAFGYTVEETKSLLDTLGDTLAVVGGGQLEIGRITKAFGDIRAKGRLMQQELNQLTNVGINPYEALAKGGLVLTEQQLKNVGRAGISAAEAIPALQKGLEMTFGGGAAEYLQTFNGQVAKLKDNLKQAAGGESEGIFKTMRDGLFEINEWIDSGGASRVMKGILTVGAAVGGVLAVGFVILRGAFNDVMNALEPATPFFENVLLPLLKGIGVAIIAGVVVGFKLLVFVLKIAANVLGFVGKVLAPLKPLFYGIGFVIGTIFGPWILKAISLIGKFGFGFQILGAIVGAAAIPFRIFGAGIAFVGGAVIRGVAALARFVPALRGVGTSIKKWIADRVIGVYLALDDLLAKFTGLPSFMSGIAQKAGQAFLLGLKDAFKKVVGLFTTVGTFVASVGGEIKKWLNDKTILGDPVDLGIVSFTMPALATGGMITSGGLALVGERGPEIVRLPTGSNVAPLKPATARKPGPSALTGQGGGFDSVRVQVVSPIHLDRREIGLAMGEYVAERKARK